MFPEEKLALNWVKRLKLEHPINVNEVVREFADIEERGIPFDVDALLISKNHRHNKPLIILNTEAHPARRTFTLGHEIGHLLIPWHIGDFICKPNEKTDSVETFINDLRYQSIETEANRFSSQFLLPDAIVLKVFEESGLEAVYEFFSRSSVSRTSTTYKLKSILPTGFIFFKVDDAGRVTFSGRSKHTYLDVPEFGNRPSVDEYIENGGKLYKISGYQGEIYWLDGRNIEIEKPEISKDLDSKVLIKKILEDLGYFPGPDIQQKLASINGVIGPAFGYGLKHSTDIDIFTALKTKFKQKPKHSDLLNHDGFDIFLAAKSRELQQRR